MADKRNDALHACITDSCLWPQDYTPAAEQASKKRKAHALALKAERQRESQKRRDVCSFTPVSLSRGDKVFFASDVPRPLVNRVIAARAVNETANLVQAAWFVVGKVDNVAETRVAWAACLLGGLLTDSIYLSEVAAAQDPRPRGVCMAFNAALKTRRRFWCSARFKELAVHATLQSCVATARGKWKEVTLDDFAKLATKKDGLNAIAFTTAAEQELGRVGVGLSLCFD